MILLVCSFFLVYKLFLWPRWVAIQRGNTRPAFSFFHIFLLKPGRINAYTPIMKIFWKHKMTSFLRMGILSTNGLLKQTPCSAARLYSTTIQHRPVGPPVEPELGMCCGQGCVNCVWLVYANDLIDYYSGQRIEETMKEIEKKVPDPNIRSYILSELRLKMKRSQQS
ncbi:hypothetical protein Aduo_006193 [Ancylostoma duodenale]